MGFLNRTVPTAGGQVAGSNVGRPAFSGFTGLGSPGDMTRTMQRSGFRRPPMQGPQQIPASGMNQIAGPQTPQQARPGAAMGGQMQMPQSPEFRAIADILQKVYNVQV